MSPAPRSRLDSLAGVAFALCVLNVLLAHGNAWPTLWPAVEWRLAPELAPAVALIAIWALVGRRVPRRLEAVLAVVGTLWVVLHYIDVTVPAVLGRRINLYWDVPHLGAVLRMGGSAGATTRVLLVLAGGVLVLSIVYLIVRRCIDVLARGAEGRPGRGLMLAFAGVTLVSWLAQAVGGRPPAQLFAAPVSAMVVEQYRLLSTALSRTAGAERLGPGPTFAGTLAGLRGADVLIVFAEAYGAVTLDRPEIARALDGHRARLAAAIAASGRQVVSARLVSPTFGGASWLAHAGLLSGLDMRAPADYQLLLTTDRPTLVRHFAENGYRTVGWLPGIQLPWPEGAFYGFDRYADAGRIGYGGRPFGFWRIPDQASMALIHAQEFGGDFLTTDDANIGSGAGATAGTAGDADRTGNEASPGPRPPIEGGAVRPSRLIVFATVTTHAPFRALPPYSDDWVSLLGPEAFSAEEVQAAEAVPTSWSNPLPAYIASMRYQFDWLADYLARHAPADLVTIVIGDHQPIGTVSGPDQPWEVPVHVITDNPALLERFESAGFVAGLHPPADPLGPTHALTPILIDAFDRTD